MCLKLGYSKCSKSLVGTYDTWSQKPKLSFNTVITQILPHGTKYCMTHKKNVEQDTHSYIFFLLQIEPSKFLPV